MAGNVNMSSNNKDTFTIGSELERDNPNADVFTVHANANFTNDVTIGSSSADILTINATVSGNIGNITASNLSITGGTIYYNGTDLLSGMGGGGNNGGNGGSNANYYEEFVVSSSTYHLLDGANDSAEIIYVDYPGAVSIYLPSLFDDLSANRKYTIKNINSASVVTVHDSSSQKIDYLYDSVDIQYSETYTFHPLKNTNRQQLFSWQILQSSASQGGTTNNYLINTSQDSNVIVQIPMSGTNGSTSFPNIAVKPLNLINNNVSVSTASEKWAGSGSAYFNGSGDYLYCGYKDSLAWGPEDFTAEWWMNPDNGYGSGGFSIYAGGLVDFRSSGGSAGYLVMITTDGKIAVWWAGGPQQLISNSTIPTGSWSNVVVQRKSGVLNIYINGSLDASVANTLVQTDGQLTIGSTTEKNTNFLQYKGYMSDLRISNIARYDGTFFAPTAPYPDPKEYGNLRSRDLVVNTLTALSGVTAGYVSDFETATFNNVVIRAGNIDGTVIGDNEQQTAHFTTVTASAISSSTFYGDGSHLTNVGNTRLYSYNYITSNCTISANTTSDLYFINTDQIESDITINLPDAASQNIINRKFVFKNISSLVSATMIGIEPRYGATLVASGSQKIRQFIYTGLNASSNISIYNGKIYEFYACLDPVNNEPSWIILYYI